MEGQRLSDFSEQLWRETKYDKEYPDAEKRRDIQENQTFRPGRAFLPLVAADKVFPFQSNKHYCVDQIKGKNKSK